MSARVLQIKKERVEFTRHKSWIISARIRTTLLLLLADIFSFLISAFLAIFARLILNDGWRFDLYPQVIPVMIVSLIFYSLIGLYPAVGLSPVEELRKLSTTTALVVLSFASVSFWLRNAEDYSRLTLTLTWIFSLVLLPLGRDLIRAIGIHFKIWGEPVAIIGYGNQGKWALDYFLEHPQLGLNPIAIYDFFRNAIPEKDQIKFLNADGITDRAGLGVISSIETALIILSDVPVNYINNLANNKQGGFQRLILIPNLEQISSHGVIPFDFGGILGLEVRHNLQNKSQQVMKRAMDIVITFIGGLLISPFLLVISCLIKFSSKGNIIYGHTRIGKDGRKFKAWKFRTMETDADLKLREYLDKNPELRQEWETTHKLKDDPRVLWLGKILRRFSIDELPQLFNVLMGEMSLIGPRPIVEDEIFHYGDRFDPYTWVKPGITGLWQVSGRNDTTYEERVSLDEYYVRNWSIWLDFHVLGRTLWIVLRRKGAY